MSGPVRRIIYLNGVDTGLSAYSAAQATASLCRVLRARGDLRVTQLDLRVTHRTSQGRADFTWPPSPETRS